MKGLCIAKMAGEKLPTDEQLENCFQYCDSFSFAYNKNNRIYIHRNIKDLKKYHKIIKKYNVDENCGMIFKFASISYNNNEKNVQPLIICDNYELMEQQNTKKSVIVFHEDIDGFENNEICSEKQFCKNLSHFDRKKNIDLFELSVADNLVAILNPNGSIELYGLEKYDKWEKVGRIFFSDNDYKIASYSYSNTKYNNYDWETNYNCLLPCECCFKYSTSLTYSRGLMVCDQCFKNREKL